MHEAVKRVEDRFLLQRQSLAVSLLGSFKMRLFVVPRICSKQDEEGMEVKREREAVQIERRYQMLVRVNNYVVRKAVEVSSSILHPLSRLRIGSALIFRSFRLPSHPWFRGF